MFVFSSLFPPLPPPPPPHFSLLTIGYMEGTFDLVWRKQTTDGPGEEEVALEWKSSATLHEMGMPSEPTKSYLLIQERQDGTAPQRAQQVTVNVIVTSQGSMNVLPLLYHKVLIPLLLLTLRQFFYETSWSETRESIGKHFVWLLVTKQNYGNRLGLIKMKLMINPVPHSLLFSSPLLSPLSFSSPLSSIPSILLPPFLSPLFPSSLSSSPPPTIAGHSCVLGHLLHLLHLCLSESEQPK